MAVFDITMSMCVHVRSRFSAPLISGCEVSKQKQKSFLAWIFLCSSLGWMPSQRKSGQKKKTERERERERNRQREIGRERNNRGEDGPTNHQTGKQLPWWGSWRAVCALVVWPPDWPVSQMATQPDGHLIQVAPLAGFVLSFSWVRHQAAGAPRQMPLFCFAKKKVRSFLFLQ